MKNGTNKKVRQDEMYHYDKREKVKENTKKNTTVVGDFIAAIYLTIAILFFVISTVLKILNIINLSWVWILSPIWITVTILIIYNIWVTIF